MLSALKNSLRTNVTLKTLSFVLGYSCWSILSQAFTQSLSFDVPLCFYGEPDTNTQVHAPETIAIKLAGKRTDLHNLDIKNLAIHINLQELSAGKNLIILENKKLFLPDCIKLVHYNPLNLIVDIEANTSKA